MQGFFDGGRGGSQEAPNGEPSFFCMYYQAPWPEAGFNDGMWPDK